MQILIKWLAPIIAIGVVIFLIYFFISINSQIVPSNDGSIEFQEKLKQMTIEKSWLDYFSKTKKLDYSYPVNEIYFRIDLNEKITKTITYILSANIKDPYQLFCLKEELKQYGLKYFLKKDRLGIYLLIYSKNIKKLNFLVKVLKDYKINAQIEQL